MHLALRWFFCWDERIEFVQAKTGADHGIVFSGTVTDGIRCDESCLGQTFQCGIFDRAPAVMRQQLDAVFPLAPFDQILIRADPGDEVA